MMKIQMSYSRQILLNEVQGEPLPGDSPKNPDSFRRNTIESITYASPAPMIGLTSGASTAAMNVSRFIVNPIEILFRRLPFDIKIASRPAQPKPQPPLELDIETAPIEYRNGSEDIVTRKQPGIKKFTNLSLKRGSSPSR